MHTCISISANLCPRQLRGPNPNGCAAKAYFCACFPPSSLSHRSGLNVSGSSNIWGFLVVAMFCSILTVVWIERKKKMRLLCNHKLYFCTFLFIFFFCWIWYIYLIWKDVGYLVLLDICLGFFLSKLVASLTRNCFPKRPSTHRFKRCQTIWCSRWFCNPPPLFWGCVLLYFWSPKGGCCSILEDLSCSWSLFLYYNIIVLLFAIDQIKTEKAVFKKSFVKFSVKLKDARPWYHLIVLHAMSIQVK